MAALCKDARDFEFIDHSGEPVMPPPSSSPPSPSTNTDDDQQQSSSSWNKAILGQGANGVALRCRCAIANHPRLDERRRYALKVCFNFDALSTDQARGAFVNEFIELVKLPSHRHVVRFLCQFVAETRHVSHFIPSFVPRSAADGRALKSQFFVLELLSTSLASWLRSRHGDGREAWMVGRREASLIISQVGSALRHLERHRVAHRDIKLDNVLVELSSATTTTNDDDGNGDGRRRGGGEIKRCVVADFGTSCRLNENKRDTMVVSDTGRVLSPMWGNAAHIAPELHSALGSAIISQQQRSSSSSSSSRESRGGRVEVEVDFSKQGSFELGVLGFEVLTGAGPIDEYPASCTDGREGKVEYADSRIASIIDTQRRQLERHRQPLRDASSSSSSSSSTSSSSRAGAGEEEEWEMITEEQEEMLRRAVSSDASRRPSLDEMIDCFDRDRTLRLE